MPDRLRPTERYEQVKESDKRRFWAFVCAATVATVLFVSLLVIYRSFPTLVRGPDPSEIAQILRIYISQLVFAAVPVTLVMLIFVIPAYHVMRYYNMLTTRNVLIASFMVGVLAGFFPLLLGAAIVLDLRGEEQWTWSHIAGSLIIALPAGVCALIGGLVFCRMTIWRKPGADIAPGDG